MGNRAVPGLLITLVINFVAFIAWANNSRIHIGYCTSLFGPYWENIGRVFFFFCNLFVSCCCFQVCFFFASLWSINLQKKEKNDTNIFSIRTEQADSIRFFYIGFTSCCCLVRLKLVYVQTVREQRQESKDFTSLFEQFLFHKLNLRHCKAFLLCLFLFFVCLFVFLSKLKHFPPFKRTF